VPVPISAIFVFQKSYTGNILRIRQNESQTSYFSRHEDGVQSRDGGGLGGRKIIGWHAPHWPPPRWCGTLVHPLTSPFRLYILSEAKTLSHPVSIHEKFRSAAAIEDQFRETEVSVSTPYRDGELPPKPSPSTPPPSPSLLLSPMMRRA
jgi:hypothetical protein